MAQIIVTKKADLKKVEAGDSIDFQLPGSAKIHETDDPEKVLALAEKEEAMLEEVNARLSKEAEKEASKKEAGSIRLPKNKADKKK